MSTTAHGMDPATLHDAHLRAEVFGEGGLLNRQFGTGGWRVQKAVEDRFTSEMDELTD